MSSSQLSALHNQARTEAEGDIYDYDGVYDSMKANTSYSHPLSQAQDTKDAPVSSASLIDICMCDD
jgi:hypothetical protein